MRQTSITKTARYAGNGRSVRPTDRKQWHNSEMMTKACRTDSMTSTVMAAVFNSMRFWCIYVCMYEGSKPSNERFLKAGTMGVLYTDIIRREATFYVSSKRLNSENLVKLIPVQKPWYVHLLQVPQIALLPGGTCKYELPFFIPRPFLFVVVLLKPIIS